MSLELASIFTDLNRFFGVRVPEALQSVTAFFNSLSNFVWGPVTLILLVGTGVYLTIRTRGVQFRGFFHAFYLALIKRKEVDAAPGDITHFQALMTALAATVGVGNIAGVATAIACGGPGAVFWMWMTGLVGMATKYSEAVLAVRYRIVNHRGEMSGGPMYYLSRGLGLPWLGFLFAVFAAVAAFGIGDMVQSNSVAEAAKHAWGIPTWVTGLTLTVCTGLVLLGGIKSIARMSEAIVPVMIIFYMVASVWILATHLLQIPGVIGLIFAKAFSPMAAGGGFLGVLVQQVVKDAKGGPVTLPSFMGASVQQAMRYGVARGVFSNESGLGSSPIAAAAAKTKDPATQALVSMTQTFIDTLFVNTGTALVILLSGEWRSVMTGAELSMAAFSTALPNALGALVVPIGLALFAYSTLLGWSYYGEKAVEYLFGEKAIFPYRMVFTALVFVGAVVQLELVWSFADVMNGLMAWPNLVGLIFLSGVVAEETQRYFAALREKKVAIAPANPRSAGPQRNP